MLKNNTLDGNIVEICGKSNVGKTQLCLTVMANNFRNNSEIEQLFINTKCDFNTERFLQILNTDDKFKNSNEINALENIRIENVFSAEKLLETLQELNNNMNKYFKNLRIIYIDSMPSIFLNFEYSENIKSKFLVF